MKGLTMQVIDFVEYSARRKAKTTPMHQKTFKDSPAVSQGENNSLSTFNRVKELRCVAEEPEYALQVRVRYYMQHAGPNAPEFYNMLWAVMLNPNLLPVQKLIYLFCLADGKNFAWSTKRLAALAGVSEPTVKRAMRALEREGAIKRQRRYQQTTIIVVGQAPLDEEFARLAEELRTRQQPKSAVKNLPATRTERSPVIFPLDHPRSTTSYIYTLEKKDKRASNTQDGSITGEGASIKPDSNRKLTGIRPEQTITDDFVELEEKAL